MKGLHIKGIDKILQAVETFTPQNLAIFALLDAEKMEVSFNIIEPERGFFKDIPISCREESYKPNIILLGFVNIDISTPEEIYNLICWQCCFKLFNDAKRKEYAKRAFEAVKPYCTISL